MRPVEIAREALRNILRGVTRPSIFAGAFGLLVGGLVMLDLRILVDANQTLTRWREAGASVVTVSAPDGIDGAACEALSDTAGITASGAGRMVASGLPLPALPLGTPALAEVTPGLVNLLMTTAGGTSTAATPAFGGLLLSDSLADALDRGPGSTLATGLGSARIAGAYAMPDDGRDSTLGYAALAEVPAQGRFDFCWAEVWPPSEATAGLVRSALAVGTEVQATTGQLNPTLGSTLDPAVLYAGRATRYAPVACLVAGLLLGLVSVRLRRLELASALHAGITHTALRLQVGLETVIWVTASLVLSAPVVWAGASVGNSLSPATTGGPALVGLGAGVVGVFLGAVAALAITQEEHLFRYFKQR
jgi:hypothetical protein